MFLHKTRTYIREWSSIKGRRGLQNGRGGGQVKFFPYKKVGGGGRKYFSHPKRGGTTSFGVVLTWLLGVLTILKSGVTKISTL